MPVLPVQSDDWGELALAVARVCIDPASFEATASLDDEVQGNVIAGLVGIYGIQNIRPTQEQFNLVHKASPQRLATIAENETAVRDATIAGLILKTAMRLAHYAPRTASIKQAMKIVSYGFKSGPHPLGISALKQRVWGRFKSVSHLTGALFLAPRNMLPAARLIDEMRESARTQKIEPLKRRLSKNEKREAAVAFDEISAPVVGTLVTAIQQQYAVAEKLRTLAEEFFPPGQKARVEPRPLLDPQVMWRIPPQFKLPDVDLDFGPPLTAVELSIVGKIK